MFQILSAAEATSSIVVAAIPVTTKFFTKFVPRVYKKYVDKVRSQTSGKESDEVPLSSLVEPVPLRQGRGGTPAPRLPTVIVMPNSPEYVKSTSSSKGSTQDW